MKNVIFFLLLIIGYSSIVSAQEVTVAYIKESKTNAEWLETASIIDTLKYPLSNYDKEEISKITDHLKTGVVISKVGLITALIPLVNIPLNATVGLFGRIPAQRKLKNFIDLRYSDAVIASGKYSHKNLKHLLEAKRNLDKAKRNSKIGIAFQVAGAILISKLDSQRGFTPSLQDFGLFVIPPFICSITTAVNLPRLNKVKRALSQIQ